jgi:hypothetical protein
LELTASSFIVGAMLVPTIVFMRDASRFTRDLETRSVMHLMCTNKMEQQCAFAAQYFENRELKGDFGGQDFPNLCYESSSTTASSSGGIPNQLMAIEVNVWQDTDNDKRLDSGERSISMRTKVSSPRGP